MTDTFEARKKLYRLLDGMAIACGRVKFSDDEAQEYFRHLSHYQYDIVALAIDNLVSESRPDSGGFRNAPMVGQIVAEIKSIKADRANHLVPEYCETCNSTGMILVDSPDKQPAAYRCSCRNGQRLDRALRSWDEIKDRFAVPDDCFPTKLPLVTAMTIEAMADDAVFERGCEVAKLCATCGKSYNVRHERRMTKAQLVQFHLQRPAECEPCIVERGKKAGLWT